MADDEVMALPSCASAECGCGSSKRASSKNCFRAIFLVCTCILIELLVKIMRTVWVRLSMGEWAVSPLLFHENYRKEHPSLVETGRMLEQRRNRLSDAMRQEELDGVIVLGPSNQLYLGVGQPYSDAGRTHHEGVVAMWGRDSKLPCAWTGTPECLASDIPRSQVFPPLAIDCEEGLPALAKAVSSVFPNARRVGLDELTAPMMNGLAELLNSVEFCDAGAAFARARLIKTADEIECLRQAQRINEAAMLDAYKALHPGIRQNELSAVFLRRAFELGADSSVVDPIWTVAPAHISDGPPTISGDIAFPQTSNDRFLREGDLIMSDTGITWNGYHSDFGKTWICSNDPRPSPELISCFDQWCELMDRVYAVLRPRATCGDLVRAAASVKKKHALAHFYLAHGIGLSSAEPPFVGTDLGMDFDDTVVLAPGMVLVFEPVIWREGTGGFRSEEIVHVTADGFERLSAYGYEPFQ